MKVVTEILQDLEILKRLLKHNANLKIRINYYLTFGHRSAELSKAFGLRNLCYSKISVVMLLGYRIAGIS